MTEVKPIVIDTRLTHEVGEVVVKRGRERPRKETPLREKRARGRPRKEKPLREKRPRGRPRKIREFREKRPVGRPKKWNARV